MEFFSIIGDYVPRTPTQAQRAAVHHHGYPEHREKQLQHQIPGAARTGTA